MGAITRRGFLNGTIALASGAAVSQGLLGSASQSKAAEAGDSSNTGQFYNPTPQDDSWTSYTTDYADIFSPIAVGPLNLKNRLIKSSAGSDTTNKEEKAVAAVSQAALEYYTRIAKGGVAAIVLEADVLSHLGFAQRLDLISHRGVVVGHDGVQIENLPVLKLQSTGKSLYLRVYGCPHLLLFLLRVGLALLGREADRQAQQNDNPKKFHRFVSCQNANLIKKR